MTILALGCGGPSSDPAPVELRVWAEEVDDTETGPSDGGGESSGSVDDGGGDDEGGMGGGGGGCPPGVDEHVLESGVYTCPLLDAEGDPLAEVPFMVPAMVPMECAFPLMNEAGAKAECDAACVLEGVERECDFEADDPQPLPEQERTCCSETCRVGEDSEASDNGPDGNPPNVDYCTDHLLVGGCSQLADTDVLAIHDAQPMVEASVLSHATTQSLTDGLGCNADTGLNTQQSESTGMADTGDANYTFTAQPGCNGPFTVSAQNLIAALTTGNANADFSLELMIGTEYTYSCACEPGSLQADMNPEGTDSCSADDPELRCTVDETFLGNPLQSSGGEPNVLGGCPMLLSNPSFTTGSTLTLSASSTGTIVADNTDPRYDDVTQLQAFISTALDVHDACGNTAGVTLEPSSDPVSCGDRGFGDPPPEIDCDFPQMPGDGDFNEDGLTNDVDTEEYDDAVTEYWECVDEQTEAGGGQDHVSIEQSYQCSDLCQDEASAITCRPTEDDPTLCTY